MDDLKLALLLNAVSPGVGGVLVRGEKGTAKSTVVRGLAELLPPIAVIAGCRFSCDPDTPDPACPDGPHPVGAPARQRRARLAELPVGATEDRLLGSLDIERALTEGVTAYEPGLLAAAHRGLLYVDEVNLLHDHLVDLLLDAAALGRCYVEREGVSVAHAARFLLVGTMNPEEGELRPQLLDRFGLTVAVTATRDAAERAEVVRRRLAYDGDPAGFAAGWAADTERLARRISDARMRLPAVRLPEAVLRQICAVCGAFDVDGLRADLVTARAAMALAAWHGRDAVNGDDVRQAARLALPHRRRRDPFDAPGLDEEALDEALRQAGEAIGDGGDPGGGPDRPGGGARPGRPSGTDAINGPGAGAQAGVGAGPHRHAEPSADGACPDGAGPGHSGAQSRARPGAGSDGWQADIGVPDGSAVPAGSAVPNGSAVQGGSAVPRPGGSGHTSPHDAAPSTVAPSGALFRPRAFTIPGVGAGAPGRRSAARIPRGRLAGARMPRGKITAVHLPATLRAAAPHQRARGWRPALRRPLRLARSDLREAVRHGREGNLVLFAVDASGSMAARQRMRAVKGAVLSLLLDAYQRRDKVGMISFRAGAAQLLLPPTSSVEAGARRLAELPSGGRTPLAAGLIRSAEVLAAERLRDPGRRPLLVVVTDGRDTCGEPGAVLRAAALLRGVASVVVDCESGPVRLGLAAGLAAALGGGLIRLDELAAGGLAATVRDTRAAAAPGSARAKGRAA
ncbi:MAG TPA: VWA domain-containing protein [Streptosporangiaceae bacterium]|nr:VWA domain-containing protein [Streptosporangiaceae bacterium]